MKKILIILVLTTVALVRSEPPVSSQYLPPSSSYGAPNPQQSYGPPQQDSYNQGNAGAIPPSSSYGTPGITTATFTKPSSSYGAPQRGYSNNGSGGGNGGSSRGYSNGGNRNGYSSNAGGNNGYSYGGSGNDEENYGPAKYEFQYDVQDYQSGQDFGHMESRDGDRTVGRYYVLLPDGRKQIVNYEADENGYRPTITYEEANNAYSGGGSQNGNGFGGYNRNAQPTYNNGYK